MTEMAVAKIKKELAEYKGGRAEEIMKNDVAEALSDFCRQDEEFAQAVMQGGSFSACMAAVAKNPGQGISDLTAYKRAVQFYFPGAGIEMSMTVDLCAGVRDEDTHGFVSAKKKREGSDGIVLDLTDFL